MVEVPTGDEHDALAARVGALETRAAAAEMLAGGLAARIAALEGADPPPPDPDPDPEPPSGFWLSGGNPNNNTQTGAEAFGKWRNRKCTIALAYPPRYNGWAPLVSATALPQGVWTARAVVLIVQMPFFPSGGYSYAAAARGDYDTEWRKFGSNWAAREAQEFARPIFSPGWEANHFKLHYWSGPSGSSQNYRNYADYVDTYRRFVTVVRSVYDDARFAWVPNGHDSPGFGAGAFPANDPRNIYPGADYVDFVGVDYYDHFPPSFGGTSTSAGRKDFDVESREVNGVRWYRDFALSEGVQFLCPEWACNSGNVAGGNHGGDNPAFVRNMFKVFAETHGLRLPDGRSLMGGECYYEDTAQKMGVYNGQNPNAARAYLELFGG